MARGQQREGEGRSLETVAVTTAGAVKFGANLKATFILIYFLFVCSCFSAIIYRALVSKTRMQFKSSIGKMVNNELRRVQSN